MSQNVCCAATKFILCQPALTLEGACGESLSEGRGKTITEEKHHTDDTRERKNKLENGNDSSLKENVSKSCSINIPHVVSYFEVSSIQKFSSAEPLKWWKKNRSVSQVMKNVKSEGEQILVKEIPYTWNEIKNSFKKLAKPVQVKRSLLCRWQISRNLQCIT